MGVEFFSFFLNRLYGGGVIRGMKLRQRMYLMLMVVVVSLFSSCAQNGHLSVSEPSVFEIEEEPEPEGFGWWLFDTLLGSDPDADYIDEDERQRGADRARRNFTKNNGDSLREKLEQKKR